MRVIGNGIFFLAKCLLPLRSLQYIWLICISILGCLVTKTLFFKACHTGGPPFNYFCHTGDLLFSLSSELAILKAFFLFYCTEGPQFPILLLLFLFLSSGSKNCEPSVSTIFREAVKKGDPGINKYLLYQQLLPIGFTF